MSEKIREFRGSYRWLSNFWPAPMEIFFGGQVATWPAVENIYQAAKLAHSELDLARKKTLLELLLESTSGQAKKLGAGIPLAVSSWNMARIPTMTAIVEHKFHSNEDLFHKLQETGDAEIEEGNSWNDRFWGVDLKTGSGSNHMGTILSQVRSQSYKGDPGVLDLDEVIAKAALSNAN